MVWVWEAGGVDGDEGGGEISAAEAFTASLEVTIWVWVEAEASASAWFGGWGVEGEGWRRGEDGWCFGG